MISGELVASLSLASGRDKKVPGLSLQENTERITIFNSSAGRQKGANGHEGN